MTAALKLDLGCGKDKQDGFIGIDWTESSDADVIHDLNNTPWPFEDNSVDEVRAKHILEHLDDLDKVLKEIHRVCKPGARVHIAVPSFWHYQAVASLHHRHFFVRYSFNAYEYEVEDFPKLFKVVKNPSMLTNIPFIKELPCFWELKFELEVVK